VSAHSVKQAQVIPHPPPLPYKGRGDPRTLTNEHYRAGAVGPQSFCQGGLRDNCQGRSYAILRIAKERRDAVKAKSLRQVR